MDLNKREMKSVLGLLERADWTLRTEKKWCQGALARKSNGEDLNEDRLTKGQVAEVCAVGALKVNTRSTHLQSLAQDFLNEEVQKIQRRDPMTGEHFTSIIDYNDREGRRKRDVLNVFQKSIRRLKQMLKIK